MKIERPYAYCCAEGGGRVEYCDCRNKSHSTAFFDVPDRQDALLLALERAEQQLDYGQVDAAHDIIRAAIRHSKGEG